MKSFSTGLEICSPLQKTTLTKIGLKIHPHWWGKPCSRNQLGLWKHEAHQHLLILGFHMHQGT